jgi:hypothetical protein
MTIKDLKRKFKFNDKDISKWFGYKNPMSYYNAKKGKTKIEEGIVKFYEHISDKEDDITVGGAGKKENSIL